MTPHHPKTKYTEAKVADTIIIATKSTVYNTTSISIIATLQYANDQQLTDNSLLID